MQKRRGETTTLHLTSYYCVLSSFHQLIRHSIFIAKYVRVWATLNLHKGSLFLFSFFFFKIWSSKNKGSNWIHMGRAIYIYKDKCACMYSQWLGIHNLYIEPKVHFDSSCSFILFSQISLQTESWACWRGGIYSVRRWYWGWFGSPTTVTYSKEWSQGFPNWL